MSAAEPLLQARGLTKHFELRAPGLFGKRRGTVQALTDVDIEVGHGETLAIVGESGCGKTTLARVLTLLHRADAGSIKFGGDEITTLSGTDLMPVRRRIQMVFQDPFASLNPRLTAREIIAEPLVIHGLGNAAERRARAAETAEAVGIRAADLNRYPHQFSGGQRQRIAIARALAPEPELIVADEPLSALDVSIQSQIINLMRDLGGRHRLAYLFISHDLEVVNYLADRVAVMYLGRIVETGFADSLFSRPTHPYTQALLAAAPHAGRGKRTSTGVLAGDVASPLNPPSGCAFHPRCPLATDLCRKVRPGLEPVAQSGADHAAACHHKDESATART